MGWVDASQKQAHKHLGQKRRAGQVKRRGRSVVAQAARWRGQWFLHVTAHGRRREMGLGGLDDVSLKEAGETAERWRTVARSGQDPIKLRERERREAAREDHTLSIVAHDAFKARQAELKGDGKAGRWFSPLALHVLPKLGKIPVEEIDQRDIRNALAPIWHTKAATAKKAMDRLGIVFKHAAALRLDVDLQATDKARALLGKDQTHGYGF